MRKNNFEVLSTKFSNFKFALPFMMWGDKMKFVTSEGKIISSGSSLRLSRYMRISNVLEILNGQIRFDVPDRWKDPFEKLFYNPPIKVGNKTYYIVCLCFIYDIVQGEDSLWSTHGKILTTTKSITDSIVRATFDVQALCKELSKANPEVTFYLAPIDYSHSREEILQQRKRRTAYTEIEEFIGDMLLKRKAFSYEHEVRLFAVCERPFQIGNNFCLLKLKHTKSIITSIMLPPLPIPSPYDKRIYHNNLENNYIKLRHILCNNGFKDRQKIHQSRLYDIVK
jgi:hypothetical protein